MDPICTMSLYLPFFGFDGAPNTIQSRKSSSNWDWEMRALKRELRQREILRETSSERDLKRDLKRELKQ